jgi:hypothetical protein
MRCPWSGQRALYGRSMRNPRAGQAGAWRSQEGAVGTEPDPPGSGRWEEFDTRNPSS